MPVRKGKLPGLCRVIGAVMPLYWRYVWARVGLRADPTEFSSPRAAAGTAIMRRVASNLLALLVSLVIAAVGLELLTRLVADDGMQFDLEMWKYARDVKQVAVDPLIGHEHAPNRQSHLMGVDFRTNSKGLRDREFSYERKPGNLRILMLGDSLTVGWGVPVEDTFSKRIERLYAAAGIDSEVINTGVGNYNTVQEVQSFLAAGQNYRPDVVVLNFFVNDAEPVAPTVPPSWLMRVCYACIFVS